ncbi:hypothetical protein CDD83_2591 [Cordyceps sp. RAO-2017]|nr:hypothetical protein CDD83_2591 [Cordyceps sp. RAO-2017]
MKPPPWKRSSTGRASAPGCASTPDGTSTPVVMSWPATVLYVVVSTSKPAKRPVPAPSSAWCSAILVELGVAGTDGCTIAIRVPRAAVGADATKGIICLYATGRRGGKTCLWATKASSVPSSPAAPDRAAFSHDAVAACAPHGMARAPGLTSPRVRVVSRRRSYDGGRCLGGLADDVDLKDSIRSRRQGRRKNCTFDEWNAQLSSPRMQLGLDTWAGAAEQPGGFSRHAGSRAGPSDDEHSGLRIPNPKLPVEP